MTEKKTGKSAGGPSRLSRDGLKTRVRTAKFRKLSSTLWLQRQLNDPYVVKANKEGYRSRAAYKLIEIDEKYKLLKSGQRIIDLGCAPGGWLQVAAKITGSNEGRPGSRIVGIDLLEMPGIPGTIFEQLDFMLPDAPDRIHALMGGQVDGVLSDMAANTTGHKRTDQLRIIGLVELAADFAMHVLAPGGYFVAKVFQGGTESDLMNLLKVNFTVVRHTKPAASRADSSEFYIVATGFRGTARAKSDMATTGNARQDAGSLR